MRILALETTDKIGGVAAMDGDNLLEELTLDHSQRSAQSLAPAMCQLLEHVGWQPNQVELVAVSIGPGSFTGLRVGVTAAKVFAYAVGAEVLGIDTLETIAQNQGTGPFFGEKTFDSKKPSAENMDLSPSFQDVDTVTVAMDAQRDEVVTRSFTRQADGWFEPAGPQELLDADAWLARLEPGHVVTGPGLLRLIDRLPPGAAAMDQKLWRPRAAVVARLAARHHAKGRRDDLWELVPRYYRRSAAEEKWDARTRGDCPNFRGDRDVP